MTFRPFKEVEPDLLEYFSLSEVLQRSGVTIGTGTEWEVAVSAESLPTLDEWQRDPELTDWATRAPASVVAAWRRIRDERCRQAEETMAMFDDTDGVTE